MTVPNQFPSKPAARRICIVGESPGEIETQTGLPFSGPSGQLLNSLLAQAGIDRDACFVGNVTQIRPPANDITRFKWQGEEIQSGLKQLADDLRRYQPHFCLLLGNTPLRAFKGLGKHGISDWRGSLFVAAEIVPGVKCLATYHPAAVLREFGLTGVVRFDLKRAVEEARTDELVLPKRTILICLPDEV